MDSTKNIVLSLTPHKETKKIEKPPKKKRVVTEKKSWKIADHELCSEWQFQYIKSGDIDLSSNFEQLLHSQIQQKLSGYKYQDLENELYCPEKMIDKPFVLDLFLRCQGKCFYCKEPVLFVYEFVREPKQWTIERIDNSMGHIKDNVELACLSCNLRRRTMYHERFVFTKQLKIVREGN